MKTCDKICNQCPFATKSLPGWLGPHTIEEILNCMQMEGLFSCHLHRDGETTTEQIMNGEIPICRGFLATASKSCKLFGQHPLTGSLLLKLQREITNEDKKLVMDQWEFKEHHEKYI